MTCFGSNRLQAIVGTKLYFFLYKPLLAVDFMWQIKKGGNFRPTTWLIYFRRVLFQGKSHPPLFPWLITYLKSTFKLLWRDFLLTENVKILFTLTLFFRKYTPVQRSFSRPDKLEMTYSMVRGIRSVPTRRTSLHWYNRTAVREGSARAHDANSFIQIHRSYLRIQENVWVFVSPISITTFWFDRCHGKLVKQRLLCVLLVFMLRFPTGLCFRLIVQNNFFLMWLSFGLENCQ